MFGVDAGNAWSAHVWMDMINHYIISVNHSVVHFQSMAFGYQFSGMLSPPDVDVAVLGRIGHQV